MSRVPIVFIPRGGGPCFFMDWDPPDTRDRMAGCLPGMPEDIGRRPDAGRRMLKDTLLGAVESAFQFG